MAAAAPPAAATSVNKLGSAETIEHEFAVAQWLIEKDQGEYTSMVCRSFCRAGYPPSEWVSIITPNHA